MVFEATIGSRLLKVKAFFDDNMATAVSDLDKLEVKWRHAGRHVRRLLHGRTN